MKAGQIVLLLGALLLLGSFAYASNYDYDPDGHLVYDVQLVENPPGTFTVSAVNVSGAERDAGGFLGLFTTRLKDIVDDKQILPNGDLYFYDAEGIAFDYTDDYQESFLIKINGADFFKVELANWESDEWATWKVYNVKGGTSTLYGTQKCYSDAPFAVWPISIGGRQNVPCHIALADPTQPAAEVGSIDFLQYDIPGNTTGSFTSNEISIWQLKVTIKKEQLPDLAGTAPRPHVPFVPRPTQAPPMSMQFEYTDAPGITIPAPAQPTAPYALQRKPFIVHLDNIPFDSAAPATILFGTVSLEHDYRMAPLPVPLQPFTTKAILLPATGKVNVSKQSKFYKIEPLLMPLFCSKALIGDAMNCKIEVESLEGDSSFNSLETSFELFVFSNTGNDLALIEPTEVLKASIEFGKLEFAPMAFTIWQTGSFGGEPMQKCSSDIGSPRDKPTCTLSPNRPFTLKFERVIDAGEVYFNAVKNREGLLYKGQNIQAEEGRKLMDILKNVYYVHAAGRPVAGRTVLTATTPLSLNTGKDGLSQAKDDSGYYAVNKDCRDFERKAADVRACNVEVNRIDGAEAWEGLDDAVGIVVFTDNPPANGKLEKEEITQYYIKFEAGLKESCTSVKECLADIDKKLAVDPEAANNGSKVFDWGAKPPEQPKKED